MFGKKNKKYWRKKALEATKLEEWNDLLFYGQKMIELDPNDFDGWATQGDAQFNLGNFDLALTFYKKGLQINKNDILSWQNLGHTFKNLKRFKEAIKCFNIALDLNPLDRFHNNGKLRDSLIECEKFSK
jgi:tetratricopeptide (TPR) repeat protein